jgi:hypothetical protein
MELWRILKMYPHVTSNPQVTRWEIHAARVIDPFRRRFLHTISDLRAEACRQALELRQPIGLSVSPTAYGDEITSADMEAGPAPRGQVISAAEFFERR